LNVIGSGTDPSRALVLSQVILSFGIPFALIPLIRLTGKRELMGTLVNNRLTKIAAVVVASLIVGLNVVLLAELAFG
jgi:manganese transport protein